MCQWSQCIALDRTDGIAYICMKNGSGLVAQTHGAIQRLCLTYNCMNGLVAQTLRAMWHWYLRYLYCGLVAQTHGAIQRLCLTYNCMNGLVAQTGRAPGF